MLNESLIPDTMVELDIKESVNEFTATPREGIQVMFIAVGDLQSIPMTKDIKKDKMMGQVASWLKKEHKLDKGETLNLFISDSYIPRPNQSLFDLHQKHTNSDGVMILKYSTQEPYG
jgi:hypothetical protein